MIMPSSTTMKSLLLSLFCVAAFGFVSAADDAQIAAVKAADAVRIAAMKSPDKDKLSAIFSDDLRYAHSNGIVDTKTSFVDVLTAGKTKYVGYDYEEQNITFPSPGIALMSGKAHVKAVSAAGEMDAVLGFLAVWREEKGEWKFLAWQSCKLPPAAK
jgi:ketosteroid isomerase-like protein